MLDIRLLPMLQIQRDLYDIPRGPGRFRCYLDRMIGDSDDLVLPLSVFNPMGKDHVRGRLDELLALDAESLATEAIEEARRRLPGVSANLQVGLVLADDAGGGWTNRPHTEVENHFRPSHSLKRGWSVALFWSSESPTRASIGRTVLASIYRTLHLLDRGQPKTLREMMIQEGLAAVFAGETLAGVDPEEVEYSRAVVMPMLEATDLTTIIPCLFGDQAARALGNDPLGLSDRAGFSVAIAEVIGAGISPELVLQEGHPISTFRAMSDG